MIINIQNKANTFFRFYGTYKKWINNFSVYFLKRNEIKNEIFTSNFLYFTRKYLNASHNANLFVSLLVLKFSPKQLIIWLLPKCGVFKCKLVEVLSFELTEKLKCWIVASEVDTLRTGIVFEFGLCANK